MSRRDFVKLFSIPAFGLLGLKLSSCGRADDHSSEPANHALAERFRRLENLRIWAYYVPLTSYQGILEDFPERHPLDQKVIFEQVIKQTGRISGRETDGTRNPASLDTDALQNSPEFLRLRFWHDDNGASRANSHSLHIFKRYLDDLEAGKKLFIATGMFQSHFHVVMIAPQA